MILLRAVMKFYNFLIQNSFLRHNFLDKCQCCSIIFLPPNTTEVPFFPQRVYFRLHRCLYRSPHSAVISSSTISQYATIPNWSTVSNNVALIASFQSFPTDTMFSGCFFLTTVLRFIVVSLVIISIVLEHYTLMPREMPLIFNRFWDKFL